MSDKKTPRRILVINPGSTSTKVGVFEGDECKLSKNVAHDAKDLAQFDGVSAQMPYRCDLILGALEEAGLKLEDFDAFVGRGGGLLKARGAHAGAAGGRGRMAAAFAARRHVCHQ